ncbi:MAG: ATP-binding protein [Patescibacteria group bacterium]
MGSIVDKDGSGEVDKLSGGPKRAPTETYDFFNDEAGHIADETGDEAADIAQTNAEKLAELKDPRQKAAAFLGFGSKAAEIRELPAKAGVITATLKKADYTRFLGLIREFGGALPLNKPVSSDQDENITVNILLIDLHNIVPLTVALQDTGINCGLNFSHQQKPVVGLGINMFSLDKRLYTTTEPTQLSATNFKPTGPVNVALNKIPSGQTATTLDPDQIPTENLDNAKKLIDRVPDGSNEANYIIIDIHALNPDQQPRLINALSGILRSPDYAAMVDNKGHIVLPPLTERSGSYLSELAAFLQSIGASEVLRQGKLISNGEQTTIENYPAAKDLDELLAHGVTISDGLEDSIRTGRDGTTVEIATDTIPGITGYKKLTSVKSKVQEKPVEGSPNDLVALKEEYDKVVKNLSPDSDKRVTLLMGQAGTAKSTMIKKLKRELRNMVVTSIQVEGEHLPGNGILCIANQTATDLKERAGNHPKLYPGLERSALIQFAEKPLDEKMKFAETDEGAKRIASWSRTALERIAKTEGHLVFGIDDLHHGDTLSDPIICDFIHGLSQNPNIRILIGQRPEAEEKSTSLNDLTASLGDKAEEVYLQDENGDPKLKLQDPAISREYVVKALQERGVNSSGQPKKLTDHWNELLAARCRTGLEMSGLIKILLRDTDQYLDETENEVGLKPAAKDLFEKDLKSSGDVERYEEDRLRNLKDHEKTILASMAMLGKTVPMAVFERIASKAASLDSFGSESSYDKIIGKLERLGYLYSGNDREVKIQHDTLRDKVLSTIPDDKRIALSTLLFEELETDPSIPDSVKFSLLQHAAGVTPASDEQFWIKYNKFSTKVLSEADRMKAYSNGYFTALNISEHGGAVAKTVQDLTTGAIDPSTIPIPILATAIASLKSILTNGVIIGRFKHVHATCATLVKLEKSGLLDRDELKAVYKTAFDAAYVQCDKPKLTDYKAAIEEIGGLTEEENVELQLRYYLKTDEFSTAIEILEKNPTLVENNPRIKRLAIRIRTETIRKRLENDGTESTGGKIVDGDVSVEPSFLLREEIAMMQQALREITEIDRHNRESSDKLSTIDELALHDQKGGLLAFLGQHQQAAKAFGEARRVAGKMEAPGEEARAAMQQTRSLLITGIAKPDPDRMFKMKQNEGGRIIRSRIESAIKVLLENGLPSINKLPPEDLFQLPLRMDLVRLVATLAQDYTAQIDMAMKIDNQAEIKRLQKAISPYIATALEAFDWLMQNPSHNSELNNHTGYEGVYAYYGSSQIGHIMTTVRDLGINELRNAKGEDVKIPDVTNFTEYPMLKPERSDAGLAMAKNHTDNTGEVSRRVSGLNKLKKLQGSKELISE